MKEAMYHTGITSRIHDANWRTSSEVPMSALYFIDSICTPRVSWRAEHLCTTQEDSADHAAQACRKGKCRARSCGSDPPTFFCRQPTTSEELKQQIGTIIHEHVLVVL